MDNRLRRETPSNHTAGTFLAIVMIASGLMMLINRISSFRLLLKGIWTDTCDIGSCNLVRIYGKDGFFIQLIVKDDGDAITENCSESDDSDEI
ncbi:MAG: hypothetical protein E7Z65_01190 [Thermoplasmata archaeon]|nr:hypothetical protein [Thermoplasmata archaeon]